MRKILLAINGSSPRAEAVRYALGLARRLKASLEVLQVVGPQGEQGRSNLGTVLRKGAKLLEETMVATTFAEAGEPEVALRLRRTVDRAAQALEEDALVQENPVDYQITYKVGEIKSEVSRFIEDHRDTVLAVYDGPPIPKSGGPPNELKADLPIPLVSLEKNETQKRGKSMSNPVLKKKSSAAKAVDKFGKYHEAVTYAEANMPEEAVRILEEMDKQPSMILVLGRGHTFSKGLKDYAIGLAERLNYEILAVNTKFIPNDFLPLVSQFRDKLRDDFSALASEAAADFASQCEKAQVTFQHMVKFGDATQVIKELNREIKNLDYVVSEPDEDVECAPGVCPAIPVFCLNVF